LNKSAHRGLAVLHLLHHVPRATVDFVPKSSEFYPWYISFICAECRIHCRIHKTDLLLLLDEQIVTDTWYWWISA